MSSKIFISYNKADKLFAQKLSNDLNNREITVWFDEWEIKVGDSIIEKIESGIMYNDFIIVILSKNSVKSEWFKKELHTALNRQISHKKIKILPALIEDCEIPILLQDIKFADFRNNFISGLDDIIFSIYPSIDNYPLSFIERNIIEDIYRSNPLHWYFEASEGNWYYYEKDEYILAMANLEHMKIIEIATGVFINQTYNERICKLTDLGNIFYQRYFPKK